MSSPLTVLPPVADDRAHLLAILVDCRSEGRSSAELKEIRAKAIERVAEVVGVELDGGRR